MPRKKIEDMTGIQLLDAFMKNYKTGFPLENGRGDPAYAAEIRKMEQKNSTCKETRK